MAEAAWKAEASLGEPGRLDAGLVAKLLKYVRPIVRVLFRPKLEGTENLPVNGPYLLVSNHSGLGDTEIVAVLIAFLERFGTSRPIAGMVHPISFNGPAGRILRRLGAIPSTYPAAEAALHAGVPVLVFPGGDHEAMRPIWQANRVDFGGRKGFLKIARKANVPIIPMGIRGSHYVAPVLWRSEGLLAKLLVAPHLMGIKRFPLTVLALLGLVLLGVLGPIHDWLLTAVVAWLWLFLPISRLPWIPSTIRIRIGAPMSPSSVFGAPEDSPETALDRAYERVEGAVQALVRARTPGG